MNKIEVICGPMFCGKTEALINRLSAFSRVGIKVIAIKPSIDDRYSKTEIVSHLNTKIEAKVVTSNTSAPWLESAPQFEKDPFFFCKEPVIIGIDEAQFFKVGMWRESQFLLEKYPNVARLIFAGLDMDCSGTPFGDMNNLMAIADSVTKLRAICSVCSGDATMTYKKTPDKIDVIDIGGADKYESRCFSHWRQ